MKVFYLTEVVNFIEKLNVQEHARLTKTRKFFEEYGFQIGPKYVKKITPLGIWELRSGNIRLFLCVRGDTAFGVHIIYKKSQKLSKKDIHLAKKKGAQL